MAAQLIAVLHRDGVVPTLAVAGDGGSVIAVIQGWLEHLDPLAGDDGPLDAPDELLGLAGEHGAANDLQRALALVNVHGESCC
ncbi:hypothetical protein GALL_534570 [mine drainage metagenome]|uniref:Uncharacterized protein n=1 Tax=mine drainage metagenome TaxID=410659 RepID=A0A1J5PN41_9ZZZZ